MRFATAPLLLLSISLSSVAALPPISRSGRYLYDNTGARFYIKGIAYQEQGTVGNDPNNPFPEPTNFEDPLANSAACTRDIPYLQELGVNAIRAYSVDSTLNHDACMAAFSAAGIYTIIDLSLPVNGSIDRLTPAWTTNLLDLYLNTVDAFLKYDNVLAFNIGNEVVTEPSDTQCAPFIKAAARDVKAYLASKSSSALVGYASTDGPSSWRQPLADYMACGSEATSLDLYGLNNYEWCGDGSIADYAGPNADFANYTVAAYFSEFGCITSPPRLWTEVAALFGTTMTPTWSGGLAFSYFPATGGYGIVTINDNNTVTTSADFTRLQAQYAAVEPLNSPAAEGDSAAPACPVADGVNFLASSNLPPTPNDAGCTCSDKTAFSCVFSPQTSNTTVVVGALLDTGCSLLAGAGGSCDAIAANGTTGTYGLFSGCDPVTKLDYVFTAYYEATGQLSTSCNFAGNATVNTAAPTAASAVQAAASACMSNTGVFIPPSPTAPTGGIGSTGSGTKSGAVSQMIGASMAGVLAAAAGVLVVMA